MATVHAPELLIVMSGSATPEEVEHVVARLEEAGAQAVVTPGRQATVAAGGPQLDRRRIEIGNAIKSVGTHKVSVRLHPEVAATLDVEVVAG